MIKLYDYFRSTAAYRVRIALQYKQLNYETIKINLLENQQHDAAYKKNNPQGRVPTLVDDTFECGQSMAILEYLEEKYPEPALLPTDTKLRAQIRYFANIIVADMHPLNNIGSLNFLKQHLKQDQQQVLQWYHHWLKQGFDALEVFLQKSSSQEPYCFGDHPSYADVCLIPQIYNAFRFEFSMDDYPRLLKINENCLSLPSFSKASPDSVI